MAPQQALGVELDRIRVIPVHMGDDLWLGGAERARIGAEAQFLGLDPGNPAKAGDEVTAFDRDAVEVEIGKPGILRACRMACREAGGGARIAALLGPPQQAQPGPGQRVGMLAGILEQ